MHRPAHTRHRTSNQSANTPRHPAPNQNTPHRSGAAQALCPIRVRLCRAGAASSRFVLLNVCFKLPACLFAQVQRRLCSCEHALGLRPHGQLSGEFRLFCERRPGFLLQWPHHRNGDGEGISQCRHGGRTPRCIGALTPRVPPTLAPPTTPPTHAPHTHRQKLRCFIALWTIFTTHGAHMRGAAAPAGSAGASNARTAGARDAARSGRSRRSRSSSSSSSSSSASSASSDAGAGGSRGCGCRRS
jgi:uncharacterized membrane protein YgcG